MAVNKKVDQEENMIILGLAAAFVIARIISRQNPASATTAITDARLFVKVAKEEGLWPPKEEA